MIQIRKRSQTKGYFTSFPYELFVDEKFKTLFDDLVKKTKIAEKFKPRLYSYSDFVLVKLYAYLTGKSIHHAAEELNRTVTMKVESKTKKRMKRFKDNYRRRRLVPHLTDVDKFFRIREESEISIHKIFGDLLFTIFRMIIKRYNPSREVYAMVDNTEIPFFGRARDNTVIGTHRKHMGTKKCHLIQGMGVEGAGMFLFTGFRLMRMHHYRSKYIPQDVAWLRFNDLDIKGILADREFYRATLLRNLKDDKVNFLIPVKKFNVIKAYFGRFLNGTGGLVEPYLMSHSGANGSRPTCVYMNMVIIGHNNESAFDIRDKYRNGLLTFDDALSKLSGFFTNMKPWKNVKKWALWLSSKYKSRWHEETAFSNLNRWRIPYRHFTGERALIDHYIFAILYNLWQAFYKVRKDNGVLPRDRTQKVFSELLAVNIEWGLTSSICARFSTTSFKKREVYFAM